MHSRIHFLAFFKEYRQYFRFIAFKFPHKNKRPQKTENFRKRIFSKESRRGIRPCLSRAAEQIYRKTVVTLYRRDKYIVWSSAISIYNLIKMQTVV